MAQPSSDSSYFFINLINSTIIDGFQYGKSQISLERGEWLKFTSSINAFELGSMRLWSNKKEYNNIN